MKTYIFDIETNGLINPDRIHVLSVSNLDGTVKKSTNNYDDMRRFFSRADIVVGHNVCRYDIPVLERLLDIKIKCRVIDTLGLSWALYQKRVSHGLEDWGTELGIEKPEIEDWENQSIEEYIYRCEQDVEINRRLWLKQWKLLVDLYGTDTDKIYEYCEYLSFKLYCARLKEESGWDVDLDFLKDAVDKLQEEQDKKVIELSGVMPKVPVYRIKEKPKVFFKKDGSYSSHALEWNRLLGELGLPADHEEPIKILKGYEEPNPNSTDQIKDWLYSLGWKPQTFKHTKNKETGESKQIPQINLEHGKGICPSIKLLFDKEPRLEVLEGLGVIGHRLGLVRGMYEQAVRRGGFLQARITGFTNTLREKHTEIVNLPKVDKPYGEYCRGGLIAKDGYVLCGSDMASLEDRIKQSFIQPYDPDYVESMNKPDFDPHITVAVLAGMLTEEQGEEYKRGNKVYKPIRDIAKNGNYACQYGAGVQRLMVTCGIDRKAAQKLHDAYWRMNWAIKKVESDQVTKEVDGQLWLKNPINGFWYSLRYLKDRVSTLVQGTASYVFDQWVKNIVSVRPQINLTMHDEIAVTIKEGFEDKCEELMRWAIKKVNEEIKMNRELDISVQFAKKYSGVH